jgi:hypothetical protein
MNHIDDNTLYKFILKILDNNESGNIKGHIDECDHCSNKISLLKKEIDLIRGFNPDIELVPRQSKKIKTFNSVWLKAAAALVIGLTISYAVSNYMTEEHSVVVGQSFIPQNIMMDSLEYAFCPPSDVSVTY